MFSVSQIAPYLSDDNPRRKFKPWWEDVSDYLTHALLIIAMLSWTFLFQDSSSGISCISKDPRNPKVFNTIYAKYFSQKCALEIFNGCFAYYPYHAFFQWMILLFCQLFWLKLPQVNSKLEVMHQILEMLGQEDKNSTEKHKKGKREVLYSNLAPRSNMGQYAKLRLQIFLEERGMTISTIYAIKSVVTFATATIFFVLIFHHFPNLIELWEKQNVSYVKELPKGNGELTHFRMFCNLRCGRVTFVLICLNLSILFTFIIISIIGYALWIFRRKKVEKSIRTSTPGKAKYHSGLAEICIVIGFINAKKQFGSHIMEKLMYLLVTLSDGNIIDARVDDTSI